MLRQKLQKVTNLKTGAYGLSIFLIIFFVTFPYGGDIMKRQKLTMERIRKATCPEGKHQAFIWDTDARGLGLRVTYAGGRKYIYQGRFAGQAVRVVIGDPDSDQWTLESARKEARRLQGLVDQGIDPRGQRTREKVEREQAQETAQNAQKYTLAALLTEYAAYCEVQGKMRFGGAVRSATKCHLIAADPVLAGTPAKNIRITDPPPCPSRTCTTA